MYYVTICDDDAKFTPRMTAIIQQANEKKGLEIDIRSYASGEELIRAMRHAFQCDLLILDMMFDGIDGDETAKQFRMRFPDAVLAFCSGICLPSVKSFKATPFRYLLKQQTDEELEAEMAEILAEMERRASNPYVVGHHRSHVMNIKMRDILYIVNTKRGSRVVLCRNSKTANLDETIFLDEKLRELEEKYAELVFAHNSYIVNMNHVECVNGNEIILDDGEHLMISRAHKKSFRETFTKMIADKY